MKPCGICKKEASHFFDLLDSYFRPAKYQRFYYCNDCRLSYPSYVQPNLLPMSLLNSPQAIRHELDLPVEDYPLSSKQTEGDEEWPDLIGG